MTGWGLGVLNYFRWLPIALQAGEVIESNGLLPPVPPIGFRLTSFTPCVSSLQEKTLRGDCVALHMCAVSCQDLLFLTHQVCRHAHDQRAHAFLLTLPLAVVHTHNAWGVR